MRQTDFECEDCWIRVAERCPSNRNYWVFLGRQRACAGPFAFEVCSRERKAAAATEGWKVAAAEGWKVAATECWKVAAMVAPEKRLAEKGLADCAGEVAGMAVTMRWRPRARGQIAAGTRRHGACSGPVSVAKGIDGRHGVGQHMPLSDSSAEGEVLQALERYKQAARFRRRANKVLRGLNLSFARWRVLESTVRLVLQTGDACSHADVARDLALGEPCVTRAMRLLSTCGLVSHDIDALGINYRVYPTDNGSTLVARAYVVVAAVAQEKASSVG